MSRAAVTLNHATASLKTAGGFASLCGFSASGKKQIHAKEKRAILRSDKRSPVKNNSQATA
jgi:hypothetical protein